MIDPYSYGVNTAAYLAAMGVSAVCASVLFFFLLRRSPDVRSEKAFPLSICTLLLGTALGIFFAKLFYFLFSILQWCHNWKIIPLQALYKPPHLPILNHKD